MNDSFIQIVVVNFTYPMNEAKKKCLHLTVSMPKNEEKRPLGTYHFESNESIEASLLMLPVSDAEAAAPFPSFVFTEPSPTWVGFHES